MEEVPIHVDPPGSERACPPESSLPHECLPRVGRVGPVPEGFVAWVFGIGAVLVVVRWLGAGSQRPSEPGGDA